MYIPAAFAVTDPAEIDAMLAAAPLGCLVTHGPEGLFASHIPFVWDAGRSTLRGHITRANPHRERAGDGEALVIFQGPEAYVSPSLYPSKAEHGRVVPTWNYEAVHVYGRLTWSDDRLELRDIVEALTLRFESDRVTPWAVGDAPDDFIEARLTAITGLCLQISRVEAKRKLSQNRNAADREAVLNGMAASDAAADRGLADAMRR